MAASAPAEQFEAPAYSHPYAKVGDALDELQLQIREGPKGPGIASRKFGPSGLHFLAHGVLLDTPSRYQDNPQMPLNALISSQQLCEWLAGTVEPWVQEQQSRGREEFKSCVRINSWAEQSVRLKITPMSRFYDKSGVPIKGPIPEMAANDPCTVLICAQLYRMNGFYGLSLRLNSLQLRAPKEDITVPTKKQRTS